MKSRESDRRGVILIPRINKKMQEFLSIFRPITQRPSWRYTCNRSKQSRSIGSFNNCQEEFNRPSQIPCFKESTGRPPNDPGKENKLLSSRSIDQRLPYSAETCESNSIMQITFGSGKFVPSQHQRKMSNSMSTSPLTHKQKIQLSIDKNDFEENTGGVSKKLLLPKISQPTLNYKSSLESLHSGFRKKGEIRVNQAKLRARMKDIFA